MRIGVRIKLFGRSDKNLAPLCTGFRGSIGRFAQLFRIHHTLSWQCHRIVYDGTLSKLMDKAMEDQVELGGRGKHKSPKHRSQALLVETRCK